MATLIHALPHVFIPLTTIIAIVSVTGFLGNAMALYIFHFRFPSSGFNKLLAMLAVYDALACVIHMPLDIATFFPVGSARPYMCKITCFQLAFTSTGSAVVLLAIAFVRYYGIHKPFWGLFSTKSAAYVIVVSVLTASGIGLPITFLFGAGELNMDTNTTAAICAVERRFSNSVGPISYYFVLAGLYLVTLSLHSFLYVRSVITVWNRRRMFVSLEGNKNAIMMTPSMPSRVGHHGVTVSNTNTHGAGSITKGTSKPRPAPRGNHLDRRYHDPLRYPVSNPQGRPSTAGNNSPDNVDLSMNRNNNTGNDEVKTKDDIRFNENRTRKNKGMQRPNNQNTLSSSEMTTYCNANTLPVRGNVAGNNVNQTSYRILAVVIAISVTFFLSYAPHFGTMFYLFTHDNDVFTESAQSLVFELLLRSFFLNSVLDPVIYGLLSADFRREAKRSLSKLCCTFCRR